MAGDNKLIIGIGADTSKLKADLAIAEAVVKDSAKKLKDAGKDALATNDRSGVDAAAAALTKAERARDNIKAAVKDANADIEKLGGGASGGALAAMHAAFGRMQQSMSPIRDGFKDLHEHATKFGGALSNVAERIFPSFKDALAVGGILAGAALISLVKSTADWGHELTTNAKILGITTEKLQALQGNAKSLGVDPDVLVNSLLKFEDSVQKAVENQKKLGIEGAQIIEGKNTQISHGIANITKLASDSTAKVLNVAAAGIGRYQDQLLLMYTLTKQANDKQGVPTEAWDVFRAKAESVLRGTGAETDKLRDKLLHMGADLKSSTVFETLERSLPGFMGNLEKLGVHFIDPLTGLQKPIDQSWLEFIDKFSKLSSGEQTRIGREFFGKQYFDSGIAKVLTQGTDAQGNPNKVLDELKAKLHDLGVKGTGFDPQVASAEKLWQTLRKVDQALSGIKKAFVLPFVEVFQGPAESMDQFLERTKAKIAAWSKDVALSVKPIAADFGNIFKGGDAQTDIGKAFVFLRDGARDAFGYIQSGFEKLIGIVDKVAAAINGIFGTNISGKGILIAGFVLHLTGILPALATGIGLAVGAFKALRLAMIFLYTNPIVLAITAIALGALLIYENWDKIAPLFEKIWDVVQRVAVYVGGAFVAAWNEAVDGIKSAWSGLTSWISGQINQILGFIDKVVSVAQKAASIIASLGGGSAAPSAGTGGGYSGDLGGASGGSGGFAGGGYIRGPGGPTDDKVALWGSNGEYIVNAAQTAKHLPLLHAINSGAKFAMGGLVNIAGYAMGGLVGSFAPSLPSFAGGGLVAAGGSFGTVNLTIGGQTVGLNVSNQDGFGQLSRIARSEQRTSAGAKPSWYGS